MNPFSSLFDKLLHLQTPLPSPRDFPRSTTACRGPQQPVWGCKIQSPLWSPLCKGCPDHPSSVQLKQASPHPTDTGWTHPTLSWWPPIMVTHRKLASRMMLSASPWAWLYS